MRKFTPIPIILMVIASIVLASGVLFPDTPSLPRTPTGPGTIGNVLKSFFASDGTAQNTQMLSGVYASGYLHNMDCSSEYLNKIWVGIDADGRGICGNTARLIGILTEQSGLVEVSRDGGYSYNSVSNGYRLYRGDLIRSDESGTGMIRFAADLSLLRFATGTNLELDIGEFDGQPVAEVILSSGRLWGRILSATGVNLGGGGIVTGVRGTSVDLQMLAGGIYKVNTVSSANSMNKMHKIDINPVTDLKTYLFIDSSVYYFGSGTVVTYISGATTISKGSPLLSLSSLSYSDPWIRKNTFLDVNYLSDLLLNSGAIVAAEITRIDIELDNTLVQGNRDVTIALLEDAILTGAATRNDLAELLDEETAGDNKNNAKALNCKMQGKTYFPNMPSNIPTNYCKGEWNTLWTTMELTSSGILSGYSSHGDVYAITGASTNNTTNSYSYLEYNLTGSQLTALAEKTITITYSGTINNATNTTLLSLGGGGSFKKGASVWNKPVGGILNMSIPHKIIMTLPTTISPTAFIIGNNTTHSIPTSLGIEIQSIEVSTN